MLQVYQSRFPSDLYSILTAGFSHHGGIAAGCGIESVSCVAGVGLFLQLFRYVPAVAHAAVSDAFSLPYLLPTPKNAL